MTQWYACQPSEAMHGNGYSATRCLPMLMFYDDGTASNVSIDVLVYGYIACGGGGLQPQYGVGYWARSDNCFKLSIEDFDGFVPVAWCYLPDVPSEFETVVKRVQNA